jgi:hypothetical protein
MPLKDKRPHRKLYAGALDSPLGWQLEAQMRHGLRRSIVALVDSAVGPHLLFGLATVTAIGLIGYHFGTFDQIISLAYLKHAADPALYANDPFIALGAHRYTFFWYLFVPFQQLGWLEPAMFAGHVLSVYLTFWALWSLSQALFENRLVSVLAVAGMVVPHLGLGPFVFIEFSLLYRTAVLPFILWALALYVRRRLVPAFALLGVLYNFHVISVNFALGLVVFAALGELRQLGGWVSPRRLALGLGAFAVCAVPVLAWRASDGALDLSVRPAWLALMANNGTVRTVDLPGPGLTGLLVTASGLAMIVMFLVARRGRPQSPQDRTSLHFMAAALLILAGGQAAYHWLPLTFIIQLQLVRVSIFVQVLGYLYFARYLAQPWPHPNGRLSRALVTMAFVLLPLSFLVLAVLALCRLPPAARWWRARASLAAGLTLGGYVLSLAASAAFGYWQPGIRIGAPRDDWSAAQVWARGHTPKDALFITPPQIGGLYESGWRDFSERGTVVTLTDLEDVAYSPGYLSTWQPRFEAVAPGALARFTGDPAADPAATARAFYSLGGAQLLAAAREYGATYLVVERPHARPWPVAYQNATFVVYDLRSVES